MTNLTTATRTEVIDPRGARFGAALTSIVLLAALITTPGVAATILIGWQLLVFTIGVTLGPASGPYASIFKTLIRPRIGPPADMEDAAPPRFAQGVGLAFTAAAFLGLVTGITSVAVIATAFALIAALLNAVFGLCLGCKMYVLGLRVLRPSAGRAR